MAALGTTVAHARMHYLYTVRAYCTKSGIETYLNAMPKLRSRTETFIANPPLLIKLLYLVCVYRPNKNPNVLIGTPGRLQDEPTIYIYIYINRTNDGEFNVKPRRPKPGTKILAGARSNIRVKK